MDPDACYEELLDALRSGDPETAAHRAEDLARWVRMGGFPPKKLGTLGLRPAALAFLLDSAATVLSWGKEE